MDPSSVKSMQDLTFVDFFVLGKEVQCFRAAIAF
jgi:hypothetical protein